ncbi:MAG: hypothetical protein ACLU6O_09295 [Bilophila wadsworthia]
MQIHVCVKHVPDSGALIELSGEKSFAEGNVKFIPNPFDEYGIEEALKLKGDGEVIIVCAGNTGRIRAALAMGADCAIHVVTEGLTGPRRWRKPSPRSSVRTARRIWSYGKAEH